jgi:anhydro-N-acetylmuramic acid kinase
MAGAMSGTSADGVDVALVQITGRGLDMTARLIRHHHRPYPPELQREIFGIRNTGAADGHALRRLAKMGRAISLTYALAVNEALAGEGLSANSVDAVAAHGQTLFHEPPDTIQWLDPSLLAAEVGCAVVSDFRRADLAAGGQGAPLVPFADYILFRDAKVSRVLLNVGGIANITYLPAGAALGQVIAFDTGPGNCISDYLMRAHAPNGKGYDDGGRRAAGADYLPRLASAFLKDPYFAKPPPKSTDGPEMIAAWERAIEQAQAHDAPLDQLLATACYVSAAAVTEAILQHLSLDMIELIPSGGGVRNEAIMHWLSHADVDEIVEPESLGVPAESKEAIAFALLGAATLDGVPSNVPSATGARHAVVLGSVTPRP